jgi:hypothetical protein
MGATGDLLAMTGETTETPATERETHEEDGWQR